MNSLSWMIYAADVAQDLQTALVLLAILGISAYGWVKVVSAIEDDIGVRAPVSMLIASVLMLLLSVAIPSRNAIYMIAASELAARSETLAKAGGLVDPAIDLLRKKIDDALKAK